nr:PREDICTED: collagen alpha-2(I) chain-like [Bos mutus]
MSETQAPFVFVALLILSVRYSPPGTECLLHLQPSCSHSSYQKREGGRRANISASGLTRERGRVSPTGPQNPHPEAPGSLPLGIPGAPTSSYTVNHLHSPGGGGAGCSLGDGSESRSWDAGARAGNGAPSAPPAGGITVSTWRGHLLAHFGAPGAAAEPLPTEQFKPGAPRTARTRGHREQLVARLSSRGHQHALQGFRGGDEEAWGRGPAKPSSGVRGSLKPGWEGSSSARGRGRGAAGWGAVAPGCQERTPSLTLSSQSAPLGGRRPPLSLC